MKKIKNKKLILIITILVGVITSIIILYFMAIQVLKMKLWQVDILNAH